MCACNSCVPGISTSGEGSIFIAALAFESEIIGAEGRIRIRVKVKVNVRLESRDSVGVTHLKLVEAQQPALGHQLGRDSRHSLIVFELVQPVESRVRVRVALLPSGLRV